LIQLLTILLLVLTGTYQPSATAADPVTKWVYNGCGGNCFTSFDACVNIGQFDTHSAAAAACDAVVTDNPFGASWTGSSLLSSSSTAAKYRGEFSDTRFADIFLVTVQTCSDGSTPQNGTCPDPTCPTGQVYDSDIGFCVTPPDCSTTVGQTVNGTVTQAGVGPAGQCYSGCFYETSDFVFTSTDYGYFRFTGNGQSCSGPTDNPLPQPVPEPTVTDDGNQTSEPATDENQEQISQQLGGVQDQLGNLEKGIGSEINLSNQRNDLLADILAAQLEGNQGDDDKDGDGTDDSYADGSCAGPSVCNGPAIECAIAAQAYATRCNLQDETTDITETDVMNQLGATQTIEQYFDSTDPANNIDVTDSFTAPAETTSSCPPDYQVVTSVASFNISYAPICSFGNTVNPLVTLAAWIISGLMFYQALMKEW
jgi:hypothetical protein